MPSQLWQRLRAARKYADLRQQDVAAACGVNRSAVSLWESDDPENRTRPNLHQMPVLAKLYGLPVEWLLNDAANTDDVWKIGALHKQSSTPAPAAVDPAMAISAFKRAVEFELMQRDASLLSGFTASFGAGFARVSPDFAVGDLVVQFAVPVLERSDLEALGKLLIMEKAAGHPLRKTLIVWHPPGTLPVANNGMGSQVQSVFDVTIFNVSSPAEAADHLVRLAK